jgi:hypothetical protein
MKDRGVSRDVAGLPHAVLMLLCACGNTSSDAGTSSAACNWPATADTFDASVNQGCKPHPTFEICQVPNGSLILADGGVVTPDGGMVDCNNACSSTQYSLTCSSAAVFGETIPSPDPSLDCAIIPISTPSNFDFYCCPCSP